MKELTPKQQEYFDKLLLSCTNHEIDLYSSEERAWGKTVTLNELGFTLQALGYTVYILTPYRNQEYCGEKFSLELGEIKFFKQKGLSIPKRCKECRRVRKNSRRI